MNQKITIATRKSELALWQANHVAALLRDRYPEKTVELLPMVTKGDIILDQPLAQIGGKGLFLKELEKALLNEQADIAVHSMKDVPVEQVPGLVVDVMLERANPFDALLSREGHKFSELPAGACVGTSSLRRQCQLKSARPDLVVRDLRGNVNTRVRKLQEGEYDAIILACAGLERLGMDQLITETLAAPDWLPAATQGTIGIQCRSGDSSIIRLIEPLKNSEAVIRTRAERAVASALQGSCQVPLAVHAVLEDGVIHLESVVSAPDGRTSVRVADEAPAEHAGQLGERVAKQLLDKGAGDIIADL